MSEWTDGYRSALADLEKLVETRFAAIYPTRFHKAVHELIGDLRNDMSSIDHEELNREQRAVLTAEAAARQPAQGILGLL